MTTQRDEAAVQSDVMTCSAAARARHESPAATAPVAALLFLLEVAGPWGAGSGLDGRLDPAVAGPLGHALEAAGARVQLIRRPGLAASASGSAEGSRGWAFCAPRSGAVRWGSWTAASDLLDIDLTAPLDGAAGTGPQRVALVCTHGRHDACCAVRGRPVAAALARQTDWDVWETTHLGGHRFAATALFLPHGELFGYLDEASGVEVARALDAGRLTLPLYRGRVGRSAVEQGAVQHVMTAVGEEGCDRVRPVGVCEPEPDVWLVDVDHVRRIGPGLDRADRYRVRLAAHASSPAVLSCGASTPGSVRRFTMTAITAQPGAASTDG